MRRFVLLDRDGTIIEEREYLADPDGVALLPGVALALKRLATLGLGLAVVTNQSGIGRSMFGRAQADAVNRRLGELLERQGVTLDGLYMCPHGPEAGCRCRKPEPGLVEEAARELGFDPKEGFVVGDKAADMALGRRVGATTILVRTGYGTDQAKAAAIDADYVVNDLPAASHLIEGLVAKEAS